MAGTDIGIEKNVVAYPPSGPFINSERDCLFEQIIFRVSPDRFKAAPSTGKQINSDRDHLSRKNVPGFRKGQIQVSTPNKRQISTITGA